MDVQVLRIVVLLLLLSCSVLVSGSSNPEKPQLKAILKNRHLNIKKQIRTSSSDLYTTQLDFTPTTIPIINPTPVTTPPSYGNPITFPPPSPLSTTPPPSFVNPIIFPPPSPPPPVYTTPTTIIFPPPSPPPPVYTTPTTSPTPSIPVSSSGRAWCIASSTASETALQVALDYACGYGGADCSAIQQSGSCYNPNTLRDHASYAFNSYYIKNPGPTSCVFGGTAQLTYTDPSSGSCHFATSATAPTTSTPPPAPLTPTPTVTTPPTVTTSPGGVSIIPSGSTDYDGTDTTGTSSSPDAVSCNLMFLFATVGFLVPLLTKNYF